MEAQHRIAAAAGCFKPHFFRLYSNAVLPVLLAGFMFYPEGREVCYGDDRLECGRQLFRVLHL